MARNDIITEVYKSLFFTCVVNSLTITRMDKTRNAIRLSFDAPEVRKQTRNRHRISIYNKKYY